MQVVAAQSTPVLNVSGDTQVGNDASRPIATEADLRRVPFEHLLEGRRDAYCDEFRSLFFEAAERARADGNLGEERVYAVLGQICGFHFRPEDRAAPYGPMLSMEGRRSAIPDDFSGPQSLALAAVIPDLSQPALRARLADVVWLNQRLPGMAAIAIDAYLDCVDGLWAGSALPQFGNPEYRDMDAVQLLHRALNLAGVTTKRKEPLPPRCKSAALMSLERLEQTGSAVWFKKAAKLVLAYGLAPPADIVRSVNVVLARCVESADPEAVRGLYEFRATALARAGDSVGSEESKRLATEQIVRLADQAAASPMLRSHWLMEAIGEYRRIRGSRERQKELERQLREVQADVLAEMVPLSHETDITELVEETLARLEQLPLSYALGQFADLSKSRSAAQLREEGLNAARTAPLSAMFGSTHHDKDGKIVGRSPGAPLSEEPGEEWLRNTIARNESLHRGLTVAGIIEPARQYLQVTFPLSERHLAHIVWNSWFVPPEHRPIFSLGFLRFFQGDFISSSYLLIPQLENSLRHVLKLTGCEPSMVRPNLLQEDRSLSTILGQHRDSIEAVFGSDVTAEIDLIFNAEAGPRLRHDCAHGKIGYGEANSQDAIYACWFIFRLTCLPLFAHWDEVAARIGELTPPTADPSPDALTASSP